ncbi:DUF460 domain-containing protein [Ignisphaera sp. 4213-co]|uniref:DUF460 domain-containing protein n=1 Tax=Ignisphaera cupida TaxID=3050454 RepID=A0ABD4Z816_9CREN|nr:DUF460 domain-containing protein [Ignisphaera sp. 4213-co]MDK6028253.1 DUF460 domain-containing protein [Ignisphaera sp. 4213-co]
MKVMGIDIVKGSPLSRTNPPLYAVVVIDENSNVLYESIETPLKGLIRIAWDFKVDRIGVDNIFEIAPTKKDLAKIFELFPPTAIIYQVTVEDNKFIDLSKQVSKIGIILSSKPKPIQTAYLCALLALNGIGTVVRGVGARTKIIISRTRSPGSGGSRANIFARAMRTAIFRAMKEVRKKLDEAQVVYDIVLRRGRGGLENAAIIAYADVTTIRKIVKPFHGNDIRVVIKPEFTTIEFENKDYSKKYVIVGIDPGIETGIAIIDLSLKTCYTYSSKELDKVAVVSKVYSIGIPVLIATDKNPAPDTVKKVSSILGLPLYVPPKSLSIEEKEHLIDWLTKRGLSIEIKTSHERDALAAALKAYKSFEKKFIEIERKVIELGLDIELDDVKLQLLRGKTVNEAIEYAIEEHLKNTYSAALSQDFVTMHQIVSNEKCDEKIKIINDKLSELQKERETLKRKVMELENKLKEIEFENKFRIMEKLEPEIVKDRIINEFKEKIRQLQIHVEYLEKEREKLYDLKKIFEDVLRGMVKDELILIPIAKDFSEEYQKNVDGIYVMYVNKDFIELPKLKNIKRPSILIMKKCSNELFTQFFDFEIGVICDELTPVLITDDVVVFNKKLLQDTIRIAYNKLMNYLNMKREKELLDYKKLLSIINEYRSNLIRDQ